MLLIDGYNLLHAMARGRATPEARDHLISLLESHCRTRGVRASIIFDPTGGLKRREQRGDLEIRSVAQGRTADDEILAAFETSDDRTAFTVVSNDRAIVTAAEKKGFKVVPCEDFARQILERPDAPEKADSASTAEVDYWMKEFGLEE